MKFGDDWNLLRRNTLRAVIDIGSNSVRLVIYALDGIRPRPWLDEKSVAGLGRDLEQTGSLHPEGKHLTRKAIRRFAVLLQAHNTPTPIVFATAAMRESSDGADFARLIEKDIGTSVRILSGAEEAAMAARGVLSALKDACGLVCDLGGRSLEVTPVADHRWGDGNSRPIGPLALESPGGATSDTAIEAVRAAIEDMATPARRIYAVGGSWRAIGRLHQHISKYPLPVIHTYTVEPDLLRPLLTDLIHSDAKVSRTAHQIAPRRFSHLPYAALVLDRLIVQSRAREIVFSGVGVREGILSSHSSGASPGMIGVERSFGRAIATWIADLIPLCGAQDLVDHACDLIDTTLDIPSCRAETAFALAINAPWTSLTHDQRVFVALGVACRYRRGFDHRLSDRLLNPDQIARARGLGAMLRLGADISGGSIQLLQRTGLTCSNTVIELRVERAWQDLAGDLIAKRLTQAAAALERTAKLFVV